MADWTPRLDDVDRAILERLDRFGAGYLKLRDLHDSPVTCELSADDLLHRLEILTAAGLIRRVDYFKISPEGSELIASEPSRTSLST